MSHRLLAAGTVTVLSLSGCAAEQATTTAVRPAPTASASSSGSAAAAIDQAVKKADAVNTVNIRYVAEGTLPQGQHSDIEGVGQVQLKPSVAEGLKMMVAVGSQSTPVEIILLGDSLYLKGPMSPQMSGGKPWVKLSAQQMSAMSGMDMNALLSQVHQSSPADQVKVFSAAKDIKNVGPETVDGKPVTHYSGTVNVQDALAKFSGDARTALQQKYQSLGATTINMDLWVDNQSSLPLKMVSSTNTHTGPLRTVILYFGYNQPFKVQAPPAAQTGQYTAITPTH